VENITIPISDKEQWIQEQHDKAVKVHHENCSRISKLDTEIDQKLSRINGIKVSESFLLNKQVEWQCREGGDYSDELSSLTGWFDSSKVISEIFEEGVKVLRKECIEIAIAVANIQADIDSHTFDDSLKVMEENTDKERLEQEYDKLHGATKTLAIKEVA
tara:strand:+ start:13 stop:492 length:480 start_codon:yes stop_codon:yes gene_type:complete